MLLFRNSKSPVVSEEFVGFNPKLPETLIPLKTTANVIIRRWNSPFEFYVVLKSLESKFEDMLERIQQFYRKRSPVKKKPSVGAFVIASKEGCFQRGKIIDYSPEREKFRIQNIDYGNKFVCVLNDIFELEKSFIELSAMAIHCSFDGIILQRSIKEIQKKTEPYVQMESIACEFIDTINGKTFVEMKINNSNLKELMIRDDLLITLPKGSILFDSYTNI